MHVVRLWYACGMHVARTWYACGKHVVRMWYACVNVANMDLHERDTACWDDCWDIQPEAAFGGVVMQ